jgi:RimJ/RimL family protein N-acetyltransferase
MSWTLTIDPAEFYRAAAPYLGADPVLNTVPLSVVGNVLAGRQSYDSMLFGWWTGDSGVVSAVFMHTGDWPLGVYGVGDEGRAELVATLDARGHEIDGVNGEFATATAFAGVWAATHDRKPEVKTGMRLYRLAELTPIQPAPSGAARLADAADHDLLVRWFVEFGRETHEDGGHPGQTIDARIGYGGAVLWDDDGPVALAGCTVPSFGVARIGLVYTPRELRRRGYAGAVTEAAVRRSWDLGAENVVLFTDLANPTSNALYQRLGFRPVADFVVLALR